MRPDPGTLRQDAVSWVPGAIASVPDGMAIAVLVGLNQRRAFRTHRRDACVEGEMPDSG